MYNCEMWWFWSQNSASATFKLLPWSSCFFTLNPSFATIKHEVDCTLGLEYGLSNTS